MFLANRPRGGGIFRATRSLFIHLYPLNMVVEEHIVTDVPLHCRLPDIQRTREWLLGDHPRACAQWSRLRGRKCKLENLLAKRSGLVVKLGAASVPKRRGQVEASTVEWKRYNEFFVTAACGNACGAYCGKRIQYLAELNSTCLQIVFFYWFRFFLSFVYMRP